MVLSRDVLLFSVAEAPHLIALDPPAGQAAQVLSLLGSAGRPEIGEEFENRSLRRARHAGSGSHRGSLDQRRHDSLPFLLAQSVHTCSMPDRSAIVKVLL